MTFFKKKSKKTKKNIKPYPIIPELIQHWRKTALLKERGSIDCLKTRERQRACQYIQAIEKQWVGKGKSLCGPLNLDHREALSAYMLYYYYLHYAEGLSLLQELPSPAQKVLHLAGGPGAYSLAAAQLGASQLTLATSCRYSQSLASNILGHQGHTLSIQDFDQQSKSLHNFEKNYELIMLSHSLDGLFSSEEKGWQERQNAFFTQLLSHLKPGGYLLVTEASWPSANERVLALRDYLSLKYAIQAPCLCLSKCPIRNLKKVECYAQRDFEKPDVIKELQRESKIHLNSLKASYFILKKSSPKEPKSNVYRVVSPKMKDSRNTLYYLCGSEGIRRVQTDRVELPPLCQNFEYLRRGDVIQLKDVTICGKTLLLSEDSSLSLVSPVGQSLSDENRFD